MKWIRRRLGGLTKAELAKRLHVNRSTVGRWEASEVPVPEIAATLLRCLYREHLRLGKAARKGRGR